MKELMFAQMKGAFGAFERVDVRVDAIPTDDIAAVIPIRVRSYEVPMVFAVIREDSVRVFIRYSQAHRLGPPLLHLCSLRGIDLRQQVERFRWFPGLADRLDRRPIPPVDAAILVRSPNHRRHRVYKVTQLACLLPDGAFGGDHVMGIHHEAVHRHDRAGFIFYGGDSRLELGILSVLTHQAMHMIVPLASARHDFKASHDLIPIVRMDETPPVGRGLFRRHSQVVLAKAVYICDPSVTKGFQENPEISRPTNSAASADP
jgi:hypothetical protein